MQLSGTVRPTRPVPAPSLRFVSCVMAATGLAVLLMANLTPIPHVVAAGVLTAVGCAVGLRDPGGAMILVILLSVVDGAMRKWILPDASDIVYLGKDVVLLASYVGALSRGWWRSATFPDSDLRAMRIAWVVLLVVVLVEVALNREDDPYMTLNGARMFLTYVPMAWLLPRFLARYARADVHRLLKGWAWSLIPMAALVTLQFTSPADASINRYAHDTADVATFGGPEGVRATGTFSYITGLADYANFAGAIAAGLATTGSMLLGGAALVGALWCALCSGSRLAVVWVLIQSVIVLVATGVRRGTAGRTVVVTMVAMLVMLRLYSSQSPVLDAFVLRSERSVDASHRITGALTRPWTALGEFPVLGEGVGTSYQLRLRTGSTTGALQRWDEVTHDRFVVELGVLGLIVELVWRVQSVAVCLACFRRTRSTPSGALVAALVVYQLLFLWSYPLYDSVASIYYAASLAIALTLGRVEASAGEPSTPPRPNRAH